MPPNGTLLVVLLVAVVVLFFIASAPASAPLVAPPLVAPPVATPLASPLVATPLVASPHAMTVAVTRAVFGTPVGATTIPVDSSARDLALAQTTTEDAEAAASVDATLGFFAGFFRVGPGEKTGLAAQIIQPLILGFMLEAGISPKLRNRARSLAIFSFAWQCTSTTDDGGAGCAQAGQNFAESVAESVVEDIVGNKDNPVRKVAQRARRLLGKSATRLLDPLKHPELAKAVMAQRRAKKAMQEAASRLADLALRPLEGAAKKLGGKLAARAASVSKVWTKLVGATAKKMASRAAVAAATDAGTSLATKVATKIGAKLLTKMTARLAMAANVAAFVLEILVDVTLQLLDQFCVGNFAEGCHLTHAEVAETSRYFVSRFDEAVPLALATKESAMYRKRVSEAARLREELALRQLTVQMLVNDSTTMFHMTNFTTLEAWVAALQRMTDAQQLESLMQVKQTLQSRALGAAELASRRSVCNMREGASWIETQRTCSVTPRSCCARAAAASALYEYAAGSAADAASAASAAKLVLLAMLDNASILLDVFEAVQSYRAGAPSPAVFAAWLVDRGPTGYPAWLQAEADLDDDDERLGLEHTVRVATVRVLARGTRLASRAEALALLRTCHAELPKSSPEVRDVALDEDGMSDEWPSDPASVVAGDEFPDVRFLRSYPALLALSYQWSGVGATSATGSDGCGVSATELGFCLPDRSAMLHNHVCRFLRAGSSKEGEDRRDFGSSGKLGHVVDWSAGTCAAPTDYCERYEHYPTLGGNIDDGCTGDEVKRRGVREATTYGCMLAVPAPGLGLPAALACVAAGNATQGSVPSRQCESVRATCAKGDARCTCVIPTYLDPLRHNYLAETGSTLPLSILAGLRFESALPR
jgi:hypothetical protein